MTHENLSEKQIYFGQNLRTQVLTVKGAPSSGTIWFFYLGQQAGPVDITASAATIQTKLRTFEYQDDLSVSGVAGGPWTVTAANDASLVEPIRVRGHFVGGSTPFVSTTITEIIELVYPLLDSNGIAQVTAQPVVPRLNTGEATDRQSQSKVSEYFTARNMTNGLGRRYLKEGESPLWFHDSGLLHYYPDQITLPFLVETETLHAGLGTPVALTAGRAGVTSSGARLVGMYDPTGASTSGNPVYLSVSDATWKQVPGASLWTTDTPRCDITFYQGYCYITYEKSGAQGYLYWNGDTGTNATAVAVSSSSPMSSSPVISWCEWDGKLFRLLKNGVIQFTTASPAAEADWTPTANMPTYRGIGYPYALRIGRDSDGAAVIYCIATDGLYALDFENGTLTLAQAIHGSAIPPQGLIPYPDSVGTFENKLVLTLAERQCVTYDGQNLVTIGPARYDGLPTGSIEFNRELKIRSVLGLNHFLLAFLSGQSLTGSATTLVADTTLSTDTTYVDALTISGAGTNLIIDSDTHLFILDPTDDLGCVMIYKNDGWSPLVPLRQPGLSDRKGSRAGIYHELMAQPRLEIMPGRYIRFRDSDLNPLDWDQSRWDTTTKRSLVTSWFDANLTDHDKNFLFMRVGYRRTGNGQKITTYYEIDDTQDTTSGATSEDPSQGWTQTLHKDGTAGVVGDGDEPHSGVTPFYLARQVDDGEVWTRGVLARQFRVRTDLESDDSLLTPVLDFVSAPYRVSFPTIMAWPSLIITLGGTAPDGRSTERMVIDLEQQVQCQHLQPFSYRPGNERYVLLESLSIDRLESGPNQSGSGEPIARISLGEQTRFR